MNSNLRVFYGWAKLGKVKKREAISVIFENERQDERKVQRTISAAQETAYIRAQTELEANDAKNFNRRYTEFSIFLDDKKINGSVDAALRTNSEADKNNVKESERAKIADALKKMYAKSHPYYKEPGRQLSFNFDL